VAEEAGIALGTIYLYFPSKDDLFRGLSQRFAQMVTEALSRSDGAQTLEEAVRMRITNVFRVCGENRDLVRLVVLNSDARAKADEQARVEEQLRYRPLVDALESAIEAGAIRRADPAVMTKLIVGLVSIAVYQAFVVSGRDDADDLKDECIAMIIAYMQSGAGTAEA
jgi:AcrR family transcriptional regulator